MMAHCECPRCLVLDLRPPPEARPGCNHRRGRRALQRMMAGETLRLPAAVVARFPHGLAPERITPTPGTGTSYWRFPPMPELWGQALGALLLSGWR